MLQIKNTLGGGKPEGLYAWKKCENNTDHTFIDYVVSDKENAYPDGGEKDGYWYERVSKGITPEMFGLSKMEVMEYIPASSGKLSYYNGMTFNHSLGTTPVLHMLVGDRTKFANLDTNSSYPIFGIGQYTMYTFYGRNYYANNNEYRISVSGSAESVTLKAYSSSYEPWFNAGTTYKFIFMA